MATQTEIAGLIAGNEGLRSRVVAAGIIKATAIVGEATPSADRLAWALGALTAPSRAATPLYNYVLGENSTATVAHIVGASEAAVQTNVDSAVDALYP